MDRKTYKSKPQHLVTDPRTGEIKTIVHPSDTNIGTATIPANLKAFGGLSGSLTRLVDERSYIAAGMGIAVVSGSNGQIVLSASIEAGPGITITSGSNGNVLYVSSSLDEIYSLALIANLRGASGPAGNFTVGTQFMVTRTVKCTGVRFHWGVANKTVKTQVWSDGGQSLANASVSVSATGSYESTFSSPVTLNAGQFYRVSAYQTDTSNYTSIPSSATGFPARPFYAGGYITFVNIVLFQAGDAFPNTSAVTEYYAVEPRIRL